jgi:hypothetical protein
MERLARFYPWTSREAADAFYTPAWIAVVKERWVQLRSRRTGSYRWSPNPSRAGWLLTSHHAVHWIALRRTPVGADER